MPYFASSEFPVLTIFDAADPPPRGALDQAGQILELGGRSGARNLWAARLDEAVRLADRPVLLVAHGVSCFAVAWWARLSPASYVTKVAGALLVEPLRTAVSASPEQRFAGPRTLVPFPTLLVEAASGAADLARDWGSRFVDAATPAPLAELLVMLRGGPDRAPVPLGR